MSEVDDDRILLSSLLDSDDDEEAEVAELREAKQRFERVTSQSQLSTASTALVEDPRSDVLLIRAFCTFNSFIVEIEYPRTSNGWVFRDDLGGHSLCRWDYGNVMILLARHSTCSRAVIPRDLCRTCVMKSVWRRECSEPCNTFYLQAMNTVQACLAALQPLVCSASPADPNDAILFLHHVPKSSVSRKRVVDPADKRRRMLAFEAKLRVHLFGTRAAHVGDGDRTLLEILGDVLDRSDAGTGDVMPPSVHGRSTASAPNFSASDPPALLTLNKSSSVGDMCAMAAETPAGRGVLPLPFVARPPTSVVVPSPQRVVVPSPQRVVVSAQLSPLRAPATPEISVDADGSPLVVARAVAPVSKMTSVRVAYDALMRRFNDTFDNATGSCPFAAAECDALLSGHPHMLTTFPMLSVSEELDALFAKLNVHVKTQLLIKSILSMWLSKVKTAGDGTVGLGFYVAPSVAIYSDIISAGVLPPFVAKGSHRVDSSFAIANSRAMPTIRPVLVCFFGRVGTMVPGVNLLPLGVARS